MKKFLRNIVAFLTPIFIMLIAITPFYYATRKTGELEPIEKCVETQRGNNHCLIGRAYNEQTSYYKLLNANYYKAPLISLGTSRVLQFKQVFFKTRFYNCGRAVEGNYNEYKNFLQNLDYLPDTIILGIDTWVFNEAWNCGCAEYNGVQVIKETNVGSIPIFKAVMEDWFEKKWTMDDLDTFPENIGFNGCVKDSGFMYDGSYYYGDFYRNPASSRDYNFVDTKNRIVNGISRFEWGEHIDEDTCKQLDGLLEYCKANGIYVIGFVAPFAPSIYDDMCESGNYKYLDEIYPACSEIFGKYGYEFYDYMDGEKLGLSDECYTDGFHGGELVYWKILEEMVEDNSRLSNYVDIDNRYSSIENAYSGYVFEDPFNR